MGNLGSDLVVLYISCVLDHKETLRVIKRAVNARYGRNSMKSKTCKLIK